MRSVKSKNGTAFSSVLEKSENKLWGAHIPVPARIARKFISDADRRVVCTLNNVHEYQCALIPHGSGSFIITVNKKLRGSLGLEFGSRVHVSLKKDDSKYGLPIPQEFAELLRQDKEGNRFFHSLTPGKQRTLLYTIGQGKGTDGRIDRAITIVEHLKSTKGKIEYRKLNESLKKPRHRLD